VAETQGIRLLLNSAAHQIETLKQKLWRGQGESERPSGVTWSGRERPF